MLTCTAAAKASLKADSARSPHTDPSPSRLLFEGRCVVDVSEGSDSAWDLQPETPFQIRFASALRCPEHASIQFRAQQEDGLYVNYGPVFQFTAGRVTCQLPLVQERGAGSPLQPFRVTGVVSVEAHLIIDGDIASSEMLRFKCDGQEPGSDLLRDECALILAQLAQSRANAASASTSRSRRYKPSKRSSGSMDVSGKGLPVEGNKQVWFDGKCELHVIKPDPTYDVCTFQEFVFMFLEEPHPENAMILFRARLPKSDDYRDFDSVMFMNGKAVHSLSLSKIVEGRRFRPFRTIGMVYVVQATLIIDDTAVGTEEMRVMCAKAASQLPSHLRPLSVPTVPSGVTFREEVPSGKLTSGRTYAVSFRDEIQELVLEISNSPETPGAIPCPRNADETFQVKIPVLPQPPYQVCLIGYAHGETVWKDVLWHQNSSAPNPQRE